MDPYKTDFSFLDAENSEFAYVDGMDTEIIEWVKFKSTDEYVVAYKKNRTDAINIGFPNFNPLKIKKIVLKYDLDIGSFSLNAIYGGIGIFVSEAIKHNTEIAGCIGIVFSNINERHPNL